MNKFNQLYKLILQSIITQDIESKIRKAIQTLIQSGQLKDQNDPRAEQVKTIIKRNNSIDINGKTKLDQLLKANQTLIKRAESKTPSYFDNIKEFTNKQQFEKGVVVYNVQDSKAGQAAVRKVIDDQWGYSANPWCLASRKAEENGWNHWQHYSKYPKQIAFQNNQLLAFRAIAPGREGDRWWDRNDFSSQKLKLKDGSQINIPTPKFNNQEKIQTFISQYNLVKDPQTGRYNSNISNTIEMNNNLIQKGTFIIPFGKIKGSFDIRKCSRLRSWQNGPTLIGTQLLYNQQQLHIFQNTKMWDLYNKMATSRFITKNNLVWNETTKKYDGTKEEYVKHNVVVTNDTLVNGKIPVPLGKVYGDFDCSHTNIVSLQNMPTHVTCDVYIGDCPKLTDLTALADLNITLSYSKFDYGTEEDYQRYKDSPEFQAQIKANIDRLVERRNLTYNKETQKYDCLDQSKDVSIYRFDLVNGELPIPLGVIKGSLFLNYHEWRIKSFKNFPDRVEGDCIVRGPHIYITSLKGLPKYVGGSFDCSFIPNITSLQGAPEYIGKSIIIKDCKKLNKQEIVAYKAKVRELRKQK